ncbi:SDR family oxidoreductase [Agrococcus sp. TF02-05]|uniref:SDR family NAD(P)-dependent oxidoreductase n=1 Tax=Agrococcus sp. TF02-05 TaxID=2815211 RepID=UPI001AA17E80|nr:SDR family NAD(P)-dependent oxidoreductase [Agrococcus sp. TF02-05]MBO1769989.1 SDR family NAD(P)-dependent oxidoreductase [Agrococcus sp. TF02-05]
MRILIAGATSALGHATATALLEAGHHVIAVGSNADRLGLVDASAHLECDLTDLEAVRSLAAEVGELDGLVHLVGGWRGGGGLAGQSDEDWAWLERRVVGTLRNTTRALAPAIGRSEAGVIAIVSTTGLERPTAGNANYVALKAAAETWLAAVGHELRSTPARTVVKRVKALVSHADRAAQPDRDFAGYTDVAELAAELAAEFAPARAAS